MSRTRGFSFNTPNLIREALSTLDCDYAFYYQPRGGEPLLVKNCDLFPAASIIKVPILFAWAPCCCEDKEEAGFLGETRPRG